MTETKAVTTTMADAATASDVVSEVRGQVGLITLNRPRALNAPTSATTESPSEI